MSVLEELLDDAEQYRPSYNCITCLAGDVPATFVFEARKRGHSWRTIADVLSARGYKLGPDAVQAHWRRCGREGTS